MVMGGDEEFLLAPCWLLDGEIIIELENNPYVISIDSSKNHLRMLNVLGKSLLRNRILT